MKLHKQLLMNTEVTLNNRRYPLEVLESIRDQINSKDPTLNIGSIGYTESLQPSLTDRPFTYSNAVVENDALYVDIEILSGSHGEMLKSLLETDHDIRFRPVGQGTFESEFPVETMNPLNIPSKISMGYKILSVAAINPSEDAIQLHKDEQL